MNKLEKFNENQTNPPKGGKKIPELKSGYTVRVHQKIKEGDKQRVQMFEGLIIAVKHGRGINATITVRRVSNGVGVERIFPIHAPFIEKIEVVRKGKVRRAKLYYIRRKSAKEGRLKETQETKTAKEAEKKEEIIQQPVQDQPVKTADAENKAVE